MLRGVDGDLNFLPAEGASEGQNSPSAKSVNNNAPMINATPLSSVYHSNVVDNVVDSDDPSYGEDKQTLVGPSLSLHLEASKKFKILGKRKALPSKVQKGYFSKVAGEASTPLDVDSNSDIHDKNPFVSDMRAEIKALQGQVDGLPSEYSMLILEEKNSLKQYRADVIYKVIPNAAMKLIRSDDLGVLIAKLVRSSIIYGRCQSFEEVAAMEEPFVLEKMPGYRPSLKEKYDQAGDALANASYPFLAEYVAHALSSIMVILSIPGGVYPVSLRRVVPKNYDRKGGRFLIAPRFPAPPLACAFFIPRATVTQVDYWFKFSYPDYCCSKGNVEDKILVPELPKNCARCGHPVDVPTLSMLLKPFVVKHDHRSFVDKIICDLNKAPDSPHLHTFSPNQFHCFHCKDVLGDGEACQRCTCTRCGSGLSKGLCYICGNNQNSLNDSPSISENSSQSPPHINHHCCYECGDPLDGIFYKRCTCKSCEKDAHIGYNCPSKVPVISNPKPCKNPTIDELPQTLPSFHPTFHSRDESPFTCNSTPNYVDESPNVFNPPPQPPVYYCEFYRNDAHYGHYCTPQAPFIYPESCYNQDFNFP
uniref:Uncharacterized protein n=1 Tax=Tanacetum cinerariifolium TaxID=118510 RepID=A0A6L2P3T5_TANCI|nr:hypothetical protein [Tanacetum cinerariifolium]